MKKLRVTVEGKSYDVLVEMLDEAAPVAATTAAAPAPTTFTTALAPAPAGPSAAIPAPAGGGAAVALAEVGDVVSPLAGKLVSIDVKVGQDIVEGAQVATIEAMKMNTYIFAPKSGRVSAVLASAGDGVLEGAVLLKIA